MTASIARRKCSRGSATKSHEADIQFALGSLMRKRGEVDRAIAIHTELAANPEAQIREQATFALGLDYLSAGLMDRAEEKLRSLMGSARYRPAVLERLAWVYEQQREWRAALDLWRELPAEKQQELAIVAAHYCCELGEVALAAGNLAEARAQVAAARVHAPHSARAALLAARIAAAAGDTGKALELYVAALGESRTIRLAFEPEARQALDGAGRRAQRSAARVCRRGMKRNRLSRHVSAARSVAWPASPGSWRCPSCRNWDSLRSTQNRGN